MTKTISEQLRDYFKMVPPSPERMARARKNWRKPRSSRFLIDIAVNDDAVTLVNETAKNDNRMDIEK